MTSDTDLSPTAEAAAVAAADAVSHQETEQTTQQLASEAASRSAEADATADAALAVGETAAEMAADSAVMAADAGMAAGEAEDLAAETAAATVVVGAAHETEIARAHDRITALENMLAERDAAAVLASEQAAEEQPEVVPVTGDKTDGGKQRVERSRQHRFGKR